MVHLLKTLMHYSVDDLTGSSHFRLLIKVPYDELIGFIFKYLQIFNAFILLYLLVCVSFLGSAIFIRFHLAFQFPFHHFLFHSLLGLIVFPVLSIAIHEALHIIPYYLTGARNIRFGMDMKQYIFYVTAHRHVAPPAGFILVALLPFTAISIIIIIMIISIPGLWKWSLSLFLFVHTTMCAGDIALLNFYFINRKKKIYTWDDANEKIAYFYEKMEKNEVETE